MRVGKVAVSKTMKILLLPGYACTSAIWRPLLAEMRAEADFAVVDWPVGLVPQFHSVSAFCDWLAGTVELANYDFIAGHSMGGIAALMLAAQGKTGRASIVLVESFITAPGIFFRNIMMPGNRSPEAQGVLSMLESEKSRYSAVLREELRGSDLSAQVENCPVPIHAFYGDRGCGKLETVIENLAWSNKVKEKVTPAAIPDACHFPMVENAPAVAAALRRIIGGCTRW